MERTEHYSRQSKRQEVTTEGDTQDNYGMELDGSDELSTDFGYDTGDDSGFEVSDGVDPAEQSEASQLPQISVSQIQELEKKLQAAQGAEKDPQLLELLKSLKTAEQSEIQAEHNEKFADAAHQQKADELRQIAVDLFMKTTQAAGAKLEEVADLETKKATDAENQKFADELGNKLGKAADKVGFVHYDMKSERNNLAVAASIFTIGLFTMDYHEYTVKSQMDKAYTVGYSNLDLHETAADFQGNGDPANHSHGDHGHTSGDEIDFNDYRKFEEVQKQEAKDVMSVLSKVSSALQETDTNEKGVAWKGVIDELGTWNTENQDRSTVYHRARLLFDAMVGEGGESEIKKAIEAKIIPEEFANRMSEMLEALPEEEAVEMQLHPKEKVYNRGGTSDRNWSNTRCSDFLKMAADPNYTPVPEDGSDDSKADSSDGENDESADEAKDDKSDAA